MKLIETDFNFSSEDGSLEYKLKKGTLREQQEAFIVDGFSWLSVPAVRDLIVDNPELGSNKYRTGTGLDYVHHEDGTVKLYVSPLSRILALRGNAFSQALEIIRRGFKGIRIDKNSIDALVLAAKTNESGTYVVDLDALEKNPAWHDDADTYGKLGNLVLSTNENEYYKQMNDHNVAALLISQYGTRHLLDRVTSRLRPLYDHVLECTLTADFVRAKAPKGTGLACLSTLSHYLSCTPDALAGDWYVDSNYVFAFGVRSTPPDRRLR